jgi:acylpyruvate hydrolase
LEDPVRLATIRTGPGSTAAVRLDDGGAVHLGAADVGALLADEAWRQRAAQAAGETFALDGLDYAPVVPHPEKVICVGLNYRNHILEMGHELPSYPTLFAKYPPTLIGAFDDIVLPDASEKVDWEAELAIVIGAKVRHADDEAAAAAIAGFTVLNDVSARDWQNRTSQFLQGKCFESTTPVGPALVTADEPGAAGAHAIRCRVDGEVMQESMTSELLFGSIELVRYISTILTLAPGDLIATGTPGGVGHARQPPVYLRAGQVVTTTIDGIGECRNVCRSEVR